MDKNTICINICFRPLPVRNRSVESSLQNTKDAQSPSNRSVGELSDDHVVPKAGARLPSTPPTSPVVALVVTPLVLAPPVTPTESSATASSVPAAPEPVSTPVIVAPPVPVVGTPAPAPVISQSPQPAEPSTSADALSAQSHLTLSAASPSEPYQVSFSSLFYY